MQIGCKINIKKNLINDKHSYLLEYYNKALEGEKLFANRKMYRNFTEEVENRIKKGEIVIIGKELKQQLENLVDDLEKKLYNYDIFDSELRIEFIESFCKHTKSPFYGKPFKLELWEKAFIEAFYSFKKEDGNRRFKRAILLVARKNGRDLPPNIVMC